MLNTEKFKIILSRFIFQCYEAYQRRASSDLKENSNKIQEYVFSGKDQIFNQQLKGSILIYAATVGELRAAYHFIGQLRNKWQSYLIIVIPGQKQYAETYASLCPDLVVMGDFPSSPTLTDEFFNLISVKLCVFVEGPSVHGYFPIRQNLSLPIGCLVHNVPICVINACVYKKYISSKIDWLEHTLFSDLFLKAVTKWYTPNAQISHDLMALGASEKKIKIVGDIKFDTNYLVKLPPANAELSAILDHFNHSLSRLIVAGSVNAFEEQVALIDAWFKLQQIYHELVLVLAPRYINDHVMMNKLYAYLDSQNIAYAKRSDPLQVIVNTHVLVVDVFGELPYFYEQSDIAFAGRGHGVLEPMKYAKPVVVGPHSCWTKENSTSYLLYLYMRDKNALIECQSYDELEHLFNRLIEDERFKNDYIGRAETAIQQQLGATNKIIEDIDSTLTL